MVVIRNIISGMDDLKDLRPYIWLCQICGFFPYRMEVDAVTKRFKRFIFSYFHPVTFWYLFIHIYVNASYLFEHFNVKVGQERQTQELRIFFLMRCYWILTSIGDRIFVYILILRCSLINKAIEFLRKMNVTLETVPNTSLKIPRRLLAGAVYSLVLVSQVGYFNRLETKSCRIFKSKLRVKYDRTWFPT